MRGKKIVGWLSRISPEAVGRAASGRYAGCESAASEVFGCIPHGARAYRERDSFTMGADSYNSDSYNIQKEMQ